MPTCPDCDGSGKLTISYRSSLHGRQCVERTCDRCNGTRTISDEQLAWMQLGEQMRHERIHSTPYKTQRQRAGELGIDCVTLSKMEAGLIEPFGECNGVQV